MTENENENKSEVRGAIVNIENAKVENNAVKIDRKWTDVVPGNSAAIDGPSCVAAKYLNMLGL